MSHNKGFNSVLYYRFEEVSNMVYRKEKSFTVTAFTKKYSLELPEKCFHNFHRLNPTLINKEGENINLNGKSSLENLFC